MAEKKQYQDIIVSFGLIRQHTVCTPSITDKRAEKSSPFGPKGDVHGLRYSRFAVGGLQLHLECLTHEPLLLVQCPGWIREPEPVVCQRNGILQFGI